MNVDEQDDEEDEDDDVESAGLSTSGNDYLLSMPIYSLTKEK